MADYQEEEDVCFEEGISWLPARVLHEALGDYATAHSAGRASHQQQQQRLRLNGEPLPPHSKCNTKAQTYRAKYTSKGVPGGPGMRAIFLDSGHQSCGTGVFLPRRAGVQDFGSSKKPACSPVLLPSRVVQALNLNVHALASSRITSPRDSIANTKRRDDNEEGKDVTKQCNVISPYPSPPRDIFLPKEWIY
ncbi:hypothetical protein Nepgr_032864 [Nepenthes gracilis]|uniref:Uncharacterized protein n=1 Tax=Nepenthes gracilis TaxID=150966 RepID=A0AAD3Y8L9_NEPGR|nr:hypothetical protein Nepgr_032864 [Nepenthes gracilis]